VSWLWRRGAGPEARRAARPATRPGNAFGFTRPARCCRHYRKATQLPEGSLRLESIPLVSPGSPLDPENVAQSLVGEWAWSPHRWPPRPAKSGPPPVRGRLRPRPARLPAHVRHRPGVRGRPALPARAPAPEAQGPATPISCHPMGDGHRLNGPPHRTTLAGPRFRGPGRKLHPHEPTSSTERLAIRLQSTWIASRFVRSIASSMKATICSSSIPTNASIGGAVVRARNGPA